MGSSDSIEQFLLFMMVMLTIMLVLKLQREVHELKTQIGHLLRQKPDSDKPDSDRSPRE